ncbi:syntaxin [Fistulina hepatica ATCC 64428]|uniref:Syntaxin n=1 Tax=Fistulina hepatica ATCC 64428 TaxID=1128425 RepID=A0A0D7A9F4_9AGAR|nr:syntaxin [Fistulina hepatica ATCC 64428]
MFMANIQAIFIKGYETRSEPKLHTAYQIEVQTNLPSWTIWRRYSEFDDLHGDLVRMTGSAPPVELPPKQKFSLLRSRSDPALLEERKSGLELYLRAIVSSKEGKWRECPAFQQFLGIPAGRSVVPMSASQFTLASWIDEHQEIQARIRDVRADINKRDALSDRGDVTNSHRSNVGAKSKLAGVIGRIGKLGEGLQELASSGMSEGELQRRTDMVARLQDDCEKLTNMVTIARMSPSAWDAMGPTASRASEPDRQALLGSSSRPAKPYGRVFGQAAPPQETDDTRARDERGLLSFQQTQMQQQDEQLSVLTTILQRQRQMGEAIGSEISYQNTLLDNLNSDVDRVSDKLTKTNRQLGRLS